jgi:spermidine/putrescine transport system ATP-binding protein
VTDQTSVELVELTRHFDAFAAVSAVSLSVRDGEFFSLIGPSGCGKTTTLRMIAGLEVPTSGAVYVRGRDVTRDPAYRRPVNTVFQQYALFPHLDVFDNVAFGLKERGVGRQAIGQQVRRMLDLVELSGREKARPRELSGGQQQRVALARALVLEPEVLLLDEPLGALDFKLRRQMQGLLKELQRDVGITFVYVTHDQEEAFSMSDRVGVMHQGVLQQVGTPEEVYHRPASAFVADFVGAANRLEGTITGTLGDGRYSVELASTNVVLDMSGTPGMADGEQVWVVVRPEAAVLDGAAAGGVNAEARVADVSFLGPQTIYKLESDELGDLTIAASAHGVQHSVGSTVSVGWPIAGAWAVPMEEVPAEAILGEVAENDGQLNSPRARPPSTSTVTPEM